MRPVLILLGLMALSACAAPAAGPARGVGFAPAGAGPAPVAGGQPALTGPFTVQPRISDEGGASFESDASAPVATLAPAPQVPQGGGAQAVPPAVQVGTDNPGISNEQDFDAVAARDTIEANRARIEAQRGAYQQIMPGQLPVRRGNGSGDAVVAFALSTAHPLGQPVYRRSGLSGRARFDRNCAKYASQDLAQQAFLAAGGPDADRYGIDPDGDGYACYWDPAPFRTALGQPAGN